jgi:hypothetical protein
MREEGTERHDVTQRVGETSCQLSGQKRVSAGVEKLGTATDPTSSEHLGEHCGDSPLCVGDRRFMFPSL